MSILVTRSSMPSYEEYCKEIKELWESHWLTNMGVKHKQLQAELIKYLEVDKIDLFTNGHMALELALRVLKVKGEHIMRIAVTYENESVFQHFGKTSQFKLYDIENNEIKESQVVGTEGLGHGALAILLSNMNVDVLICGGIGRGAIMALSGSNINVVGGVTGDCDAAVKAYLAGTLTPDAEATCGCSHDNCECHHE